MTCPWPCPSSTALGSSVRAPTLSAPQPACRPLRCAACMAARCAGTNGAGKTTTFRMLTRELKPTQGDVYLAGHRISGGLSRPRNTTGYCPQSGGLTTALSVREVLQFYARVRALPPDSVTTAVSHALRTMALREYADVPVKALSGGNCRRLSVAAAMVGAPQVGRGLLRTVHVLSFMPVIMLSLFHPESPVLDPACAQPLFRSTLMRPIRASRVSSVPCCPMPSTVVRSCIE
jgi:hypothetical protein